MKFKFFNIPAIFSEDAINELDKFCASHKVTDVEKQFVSHGNDSFWSFCVTYLDDKATNVTASEKKEGIDYREELNEADFSVYAKLRQLRNTLAAEAGKPSYIIFTNAQLADMVKQRVTSKKAMQEIPGIGKGRMDSYADEFLEVLKDALNNDKG